MGKHLIAIVILLADGKQNRREFSAVATKNILLNLYRTKFADHHYGASFVLQNSGINYCTAVNTAPCIKD